MRHERVVPSQNLEQSPNLNRPRAFFQKIGHQIRSLFATEPDISPNSQPVVEPNQAQNPNPALPTTLEQNPAAIQAAAPPAREHDPTTFDDERFVEVMDHLRYQKTADFQGERKQEVYEQAFNEALTPLSELQTAAQTQAEGISQTEIEYQDHPIPVFNLSGYPIKFLQHVVDYKVLDPTKNTSAILGANTAQRLIDDPSLWLEPQPQATHDTPLSDSRGNTLSCSYIDSDINIQWGGVKSTRAITYGFSSLRPSSLLVTRSMDAATNNKSGNRRPANFNLGLTPGRLAKLSTQHYNEVVIKRYDDAGKPPLPDFLITCNHHITDDTKHHASFFNVPIVNIQTAPYLERQRQDIIQRVEAIDASSDYSDIFDALLAFEQSSVSSGAGLKNDIFEVLTPHQLEVRYQRVCGDLPPDIQTKIQTLYEDIEPAKRLRLLDTELTKECHQLSEHSSSPFQPYHSSRFSIRRTTRSLSPGSIIDRPNFADRLTICYDYSVPSQGIYQIRTLIDDTAPVYPYFSQLVDEFQANGGHVVDDRLRKDQLPY